jgi:hypothetical protein
MIDERLLFAVLIRAVLGLAAVTYLAVAFLDYRTHADARGFRGWIGALTAAFGSLALIGTSDAIRETLAQYEVWFRAATVIGILGFVIGVVFSAVVGAYSLRHKRKLSA